MARRHVQRVAPTRASGLAAARVLQRLLLRGGSDDAKVHALMTGRCDDAAAAGALLAAGVSVLALVPRCPGRLSDAHVEPDPIDVAAKGVPP
jgi:hypothetical protein